MSPKEIFISHSSDDAVITARVAETLSNHGLPVWYSTKGILGSQNWHDEIGRALKRCDFFMVLLSGSSVVSDWVKHELSYALNHAQYTDRILPVTIELCDYEALSWTLGSFQMINLAQDYEDGCRDILRTFGVGLDPVKLG